MKTILLPVVLLLFTVSVFAQKKIVPIQEYKTVSVISPASSSFEFSEGSISWTLGDTLITLKVGDSDALTPEILELDIVAYPNPTNEKLNITHNTKTNEVLTINIYDFNGRQLISKQLAQQENEINLQFLPAALYVVNITDSKDQLIKSFKLIKH